MSLLNYYKIINGVIQQPTLIDEFSDVSNESLLSSGFEYIRKFIKIIKDFIIKVSKWIKDKVTKFVKLFIGLFKKKSKKLEVMKLVSNQMDYLPKEINDKIKQLIKKSDVNYAMEDYLDGLSDNQFESVVNFFKEYRLNFVSILFDENGNLRELDGLLQSMENRLMVVDLPVEQAIRNPRHPFLNGRLYIDDDWSSVLNLAEYFKDLILEENKKAFESDVLAFKSKDIFKYVDNIDELLDKSLVRYNKFKERIEKSNLAIEKRTEELISQAIIENNEAGYVDLIYEPKDYKLKYEYNILMAGLSINNSLLRVALIPFNVITSYIRVIDIVEKDLLKKEYIEVPYTSTDKLYHISFDEDPTDGVGIFYPEFRESGLMEFLPKRISFAPTIEGCLIGAYHQLKANGIIEGIRKGITSFEVNLFEGIPDRNTKCIDSKILQSFLEDYIYTKEIAITTPIKISKSRRIKVSIVRSTDLRDKSAYRVEYLD